MLIFIVFKKVDANIRGGLLSAVHYVWLRRLADYLKSVLLCFPEGQVLSFKFSG